MADRAEEDGVHAPVPRDKLHPSARKLRDTYARVPGMPFFRREDFYYSLDAWREQGMPQDVPRIDLFYYDPTGHFALRGLGWCEPAFEPLFGVKILEDHGDYEVEQDLAGRHVFYLKGRRNGFMPEYLEHPVKDWRT